MLLKSLEALEIFHHQLNKKWSDRNK